MSIKITNSKYMVNKKFINRPRLYYEVSNERSYKIKFKDISEIDYDSVNYISRLDKNVAHDIMSVIFRHIHK